MSALAAAARPVHHVLACVWFLSCAREFDVFVPADRSFEKDDVIKGAGRMMVQNLAGSLALVTCKEPLRHNMVNQLRGIIQKYFAAAFANEVMDSNALEPAVQMIAQDNLVSFSHTRG